MGRKRRRRKQRKETIMAAKTNGRTAVGAVTALAGQGVSPVPRKRGRPPKNLATILGGEPPVLTAPAAPQSEPNSVVASFGAKIGSTLTALNEARARGHHVKEGPVRAAQGQFRAALATKEPEAQRVTRTYRPLSRWVAALEEELSKPYPPVDACQLLLRDLRSFSTSLQHLLKDPLPPIEDMIDALTPDRLRPESEWPQRIMAQIAGLDHREAQIENFRQSIEDRVPRLLRYAAAPVSTVSIPGPERQDLGINFDPMEHPRW